MVAQPTGSYWLSVGRIELRLPVIEAPDGGAVLRSRAAGDACVLRAPRCRKPLLWHGAGDRMRARARRRSRVEEAAPRVDVEEAATRGPGRWQSGRLAREHHGIPALRLGPGLAARDQRRDPCGSVPGQGAQGHVLDVRQGRRLPLPRPRGCIRRRAVGRAGCQPPRGACEGGRALPCGAPGRSCSSAGSDASSCQCVDEIPRCPLQPHRERVTLRRTA